MSHYTMYKQYVRHNLSHTCSITKCITIGKHTSNLICGEAPSPKYSSLGLQWHKILWHQLIKYALRLDDHNLYFALCKGCTNNQLDVYIQCLSSHCCLHHIGGVHAYTASYYGWNKKIWTSVYHLDVSQSSKQSTPRGDYIETQIWGQLVDWYLFQPKKSNRKP